MLPQEFIDEVRPLLGGELDAFLRALNEPPTLALRLNRLRGDMSPFAAEFVDGDVPWAADGRYLKPGARPGRSLGHDLGAFYLQEASAMVSASVLDAQPGEKILDLCAAPGGKTSQIAFAMGGAGALVSNEPVPSRAKILAENVERLGIGSGVVVSAYPDALARRWPEHFDGVLVDAPCSGEGMFRKDPAARGEWSENNVRQCAARQDDILREAWRALRPGGTLIYSTCTFNRDEDEGSLERMLAWAGDEVAASEPVDVDPAWGIVEGEVGPFRTFRFFPHRTVGEGFFAAVARKAPDAPGRQRLPKGRRSMVAPADRASAGELRRWVREPDRMVFGTVAGTGYAWYGEQAEAVKTLSEALPVICSGVALGQLFKGRLKPDPALAFFDGLERGAVPVAGLDDEQALRYLRRQEVAAGALAEGVNLVTARGRALGFAKRIGARVNNMYPNSLRILRQE